MDVVEAETAPHQSRSRSWFAGLGDYLGARGLALGSAAVLVIGLLSWNVLLQNQVQNLRGEVKDAQVQTIELPGSWAEQGAHAEVAAIDKDRVILVAEDMPSVPDNKSCQIWAIHEDEPKPSGLFQPDADTTATAITTPIKKSDAIAVTVEPAGGSKKPTSDPVLAAKLQPSASQALRACSRGCLLSASGGRKYLGNVANGPTGRRVYVCSQGNGVERRLANEL